MTTRTATSALLGLLLTSSAALGFNGDRVTAGPLTLTIEKIATVVAYDTPRDVPVALANAGSDPLSVQVELRGLIDQWHAAGATQQRVTVPGKGKASVTFQMVAGPGTHSALYPVHVAATFQQGGQTTRAQAVAVFETEFQAPSAAAAPAGEPPLSVLPSGGVLALATLKTQRVAWAYLNGPLVRLPVGWQGSDPNSAASFGRGSVVRGEARQAIHMHPAYRPRAGTVFAEYRVKLPAGQPTRLTFYNAIRDTGPKEPASDGVTFRVWAGDEKLFERHTAAKVWVPGEVDLGRFAGQEILLRLESHPGPKGSTTCDSSFWGDPTLLAGTPPKLLTADEKKALAARACAAATSGKTDGKDLFIFDLDPGTRAVLALGPHALADGVLAMAAEGHLLTFDGMRIAICDQALGAWPSGVVGEGIHATRDASGRLRVVQRLRKGDESGDLVTEAWREGPGLRVRLACPLRITDLALGPADQHAPRVYYGHAYCIVEPHAFRASGGGHNLASSHVGFDFANGLSLLTACDNPPDALEVDPDARRYALHAHHDTTFTFVPGARGALDCALRYRPIYDKQPAGGVARKAGRFVFDIWGGRYADDAARLQRMFDYGLSDVLYLKHAWQRWGYDYRLPDIYPPDPKLGTLEELQALGRLCTAHDVPWGLHDNYVDFYPDAEDYSYEHVAFDEQGRPRKAWYNQGRDAQSYSWRPDHIMPFLRRNLALIRDGLHPSASFVDVFTSSNGFDYYDRQGDFHSKLETRRCWGEAFDCIRDTLGGHAPTSSEAGSDHLIGHLDGADCQLLCLASEPRRYANRLLCGDWDCVPWFDAVNHARFILHGVGYSQRYESGRSREAHGIESDDYLSAEMLTGHALMIDANAFGRGAVRKYWLGQEFIRSIALDNVAGVQFPAGGIHCQSIRWQGGAEVHVNRGPDDWKAAGRVLPQYGYLAQSGDGTIRSSIERIGGVIVEQSQGPDHFYVNGRGFDPNPRLAIRPAAERVEYLGDRKFKLFLKWDVTQTPAKDLALLAHFYKPQVSRLHKDGFPGIAARPTPGTRQWKGQVETGAVWTIAIPEDIQPDAYDVLVGLIDPATKKRVRLEGDEDSELSYRVGRLIVEGSKGRVTGVRLNTSDVRPGWPSRLNTAKRAIDFGPALTSGAFRCEKQSGGLRVVPLPDGDPFTLLLRLDRILGKPARVKSVAAVDSQGQSLRSVEFRTEGSDLSWETRPTEFAYQVLTSEP